MSPLTRSDASSTRTAVVIIKSVIDGVAIHWRSSRLTQNTSMQKKWAFWINEAKSGTEIEKDGNLP